jgi:hypothetical protein
MSQYGTLKISCLSGYFKDGAEMMKIAGSGSGFTTLFKGIVADGTVVEKSDKEG